MYQFWENFFPKVIFFPPGGGCGFFNFIYQWYVMRFEIRYFFLEIGLRPKGGKKSLSGKIPILEIKTIEVETLIDKMGFLERQIIELNKNLSCLNYGAEDFISKHTAG